MRISTPLRCRRPLASASKIRAILHFFLKRVRSKLWEETVNLSAFRSTKEIRASMGGIE